MLIDHPGFYPGLSHDAYHADPVVVPSLSSSVGKLLIDQTPRHAFMAHARLNPQHEPDNDKKFDLGSAVHAMMTRDDRAFAIIPADDYKTKAAREAREVAAAAGQIPLLARQHDQARAIARAARAQLDRTEDAVGVFTPAWGDYEITGVWQDDGAWCRIRCDALSKQRFIIADLKVTNGSADAETWQRQIGNMGYDFQEAFYRRGVERLTGRRPHFLFVVIEADPPHALAVHALTPEWQHIGDAKVDRAIQTWRWCMKHGAWPGYSRRTHYHEPPAWERIKAETAQVVNAPTAEMLAAAIEFQKPIELTETTSE